VVTWNRKFASDNCIRKSGAVKVIVEGFDGTGSLDVGRLYALGVRYIQGYSFGKAGANIYRMEEKEVSYINDLLIESRAGQNSNNFQFHEK